MRPLNQETITAILDCIGNNMSRDCENLTVRSIAEKTGIPFQNIGKYVQKLVDNDTVEPDKEYGYILPERIGKVKRYRAVQIVGNIACGELNIAESNIDEYIKLPMDMIADGEYFLLRAQGYSMINIGIEPGDLVLIRRQSVAEPGQVVVMLSTEFSDAGATLKRYYPEPEKHRIRLHPENDDMEDFYIKEGVIQGVAKKIIKTHDIE